MNAKRASERGQIVVIFVVALTVLLGFVALAVDGGMIFSDRRFSQGVADSASMAGAGSASQTFESRSVTYSNFDCYSSGVTTAINNAYNSARSRAIQNNVTTLDNNLADKHGIEIVCVNLPAQRNRYLDIHTKITTKVTTSFLQLFYGGAVYNTVDAVVRIRPRTDMAYGNAIMSMNTSNDSGIDFSGNILVSTAYAGIFSNSVITGNGNFDVKTIEGSYPIGYANALDINGNAGSFSPSPTQAAQMNVAAMKAAVPTPVCGGGAPITVNGSANINPGNYSSIRLNTGTLRMAPGLYCISGDMNVNGGNVDGSGVTLYFTGANSNFYMEGNVDVQMTAPTSSANGGVPGALVYLAEGNTGEVRMLGSSDQTMGGLIYAPSGTIEIGGNSRLDTPGGWYTQLVSKDLRFHGTTEVTITYTQSPYNTISPLIDMIQ